MPISTTGTFGSPVSLDGLLSTVEFSRVQRPRRWRYSLGSSSRGRCRGRCKRFGRDDGDDDDEDNGMVDDDSYGDVYGYGNDVQI